jgi:hypothetical protein
MFLFSGVLFPEGSADDDSALDPPTSKEDVERQKFRDRVMRDSQRYPSINFTLLYQI